MPCQPTRRRRRRRWDVVGPVCESGDWLGRDRVLGGASRATSLAVLSAGAYGMAMASNYNSRPRAAEVMVDGDREADLDRAQSREDRARSR